MARVNQKVTANRSDLDARMIDLVGLLSPLVAAGVMSAQQCGDWSIDQLREEHRRTAKTVEDIAGSQDLSLLLAVVLDAWGPVFGKICPDFGITYALVDKVRHIRNDFAHNLGDYNDDAYVADCKKAVDDCSRLFLTMRQRFEVGEGRQGTVVVGDGSASPMPVLSCFGRLAKNLSLPPDSPGGKALREIIVLGDSG